MYLYNLYVYIYILQCVNELTGKPKWVTNMALCIPQNKILLTTGWVQHSGITTTTNKHNRDNSQDVKESL